MEQTTERRWHEVWREQCEAVETIRLRHGVESAFDYAVGEKLLTFAEAAEANTPNSRRRIAAVRLQELRRHVHTRGNRGAPGANRAQAS